MKLLQANNHIFWIWLLSDIINLVIVKIWEVLAMEKFYKKDKFINYEVVRTSKKKEYYCINTRDNIVYISVPEYAKDSDIKIVLSQQFYNLYYKINPLERYVIHYKGKKYQVKCLKSKTDKVIIKEDEIIIKAIKVTNRYFKNVLYKFFTRVVEEEIVNLIYDIQNEFKEIVIPKIIVKTIKGYLGYNYLDRIEISPKIAKYDSKYIKVLLYHEVCHSIVRGHGRDFWDLLNKKLKNGEELNKEMNSINYKDDYL